MTTTPTHSNSAFKGIDIPNYEFIINCMHCGLCLPTCPTYSLTGLEKSSPRGRIKLIKAVADGDLPITNGFIHEMEFCLDCQACETACPAGVKYGALVEAARVQIHQQGYERWFIKIIKKVFLSWTFLQPWRLRVLARGLRLYETAGLKWLVEKVGFFRIFSKRLHNIQPLTPTISKQFSTGLLPEVIRPKGVPQYRVGFLTGCIMDVAFADVNLDTIQLLLHHDCEIIIPKQQRCCGSLQAHNGDLETARALARHNIEVFGNEKLDAIIMNSAGCGAFMKEYAHVLEHEEHYAAKAKALSAKVKDITEFLVEIGFKPSHSRNVDTHIPYPISRGRESLLGKIVTYHDACHLAHTQKITQQPRQLIKSIPGIVYTELEESTWCCGSAGIYNITHYDDALKLLERKVNNVKKISPDIIVTGNPGCIVQINHGMQREGLNIELMHTATFLRRACEA
ncbi:MAG: (Fe-S)-binding protein [Ignavibacteriales bacterium]|nr:(Fe-S)-binding protein [Ignavibacteriales bacterium]